MGVRFDRHLGPATSLDVKQWTDRTASGQPAVRCPLCGGISELEIASGTHVVSKQGEVTPAWKCETATCAFFEWIDLEAWDEAVLE